MQEATLASSSKSRRSKKGGSTRGRKKTKSFLNRLTFAGDTSAGGARMLPILLLVGVIVMLYMTASLFTFDPTDVALAELGGEVNNLGGPIGAWVANSLFQ